MQAENTPETKAPIYKTKGRYIPEYTKITSLYSYTTW